MFRLTEESIQKFITTSPAQTMELGEVVGAVLISGDIVAYRGGMGMGKTVFTTGLAKGLGCTMDVTSPTFALLNEYRGGRVPICHIDAFRLNSPDDLESIGFYDYLDNGWVIAIEWSEQVYSALPKPKLIVDFQRIDDNTREITLTFAKNVI